MDFLKAGGAKAVFFDLMLTEASTFGIDDDRLLAEAMTRSGKVLLPFFLSREEKEAAPAAEEVLARSAWPREPALSSGVAGTVPPARSVSLPVDELAAAAVKMGNVQFVPDGDSVYRRLPLVFRYGGRLLPALPLAVAEFISEGVDLRKVPLDPSGNMILHFFGPRGTYQTLSIGAIINSQARIEEGLEPQVQPREFAGKTVIVGTTAAGLLDFRPTPFGGVYPGMEILATALDNIVHGDAIRQAPAAVTWVSVLVFALLAGMGTSMLKKTGHLAALGLSLPALAAAGSLLAARAGVWVEFVAPAFAALSAFIVAALLGYGVEGRQRRFIKNAFRFYLSPQVIERVLDNPSLLRLGGERREITAFFSDVAGFTSISEGLSPEDLVGLLNAYLSEMTDIILDLGGTLDKYEGDAIIAFWNAPLDLPDHALRACRAALALPAAAGRMPRGLPRTLRPRGPHAGRDQLGPGRRRQHGLGAALRLHGHGRHDEPGLAARRRRQGLRGFDPRRRRDGAAGAGRDRGPGSGRHPRRREETAHPRLRAPRGKGGGPGGGNGKDGPVRPGPRDLPGPTILRSRGLVRRPRRRSRGGGLRRTGAAVGRLAPAR